MKPHAHVSGVGGVGMNAIAQLLLAEGWEVSGSDRFLDEGRALPVLRQLAGLGVRLCPQDGGALRDDTGMLVLSTAVEAENPERVRAKVLGIPERHRAEVLADCCRRGPLLAVAGTSGKTTCTGWLGRVLEVCGLDPNVVNGGGVLDWKSDLRPGNVRLADPAHPWVVEVDESDRSLLKFFPEVAMISTLSADHHDLAETLRLFRQFATQVRRTVVCGPGVREALEGTPGLTAALVEVNEALPSHLPGAHNGWNAAMVAEMAVAGGVSRAAAVAALPAFSGVERRLQQTGAGVYDDYAHNPEKIAAAMAAVRPAGGRLHVVWRPHGFAPLRQNFAAFVETFVQGLGPEDWLGVLPVFYAGGTVSKGPQSGDLVGAVAAAGRRAELLTAYPETLPLGAEDVLLVMGARDPELPEFAARMGRQRMQAG